MGEPHLPFIFWLAVGIFVSFAVNAAADGVGGEALSDLVKWTFNYLTEKIRRAIVWVERRVLMGTPIANEYESEREFDRRLDAKKESIRLDMEEKQRIANEVFLREVNNAYASGQGVRSEPFMPTGNLGIRNGQLVVSGEVVTAKTVTLGGNNLTRALGGTYSQPSLPDNPVYPTTEARYLEAYQGRYDGGYFQTATQYNVREGAMMDTQTLFEVFLVDRDLAMTDPFGSVQVFHVVAANAEAARTAVVIKAGLQIADLQKYHVASREVCRVPFLPRQDRLLPDNGGKVNGA